MIVQVISLLLPLFLFILIRRAFGAVGFDVPGVSVVHEFGGGFEFGCHCRLVWLLWNVGKDNYEMSILGFSMNGNHGSTKTLLRFPSGVFVFFGRKNKEIEFVLFFFFPRCFCILDDGRWVCCYCYCYCCFPDLSNWSRKLFWWFASRNLCYFQLRGCIPKENLAKPSFFSSPTLHDPCFWWVPMKFWKLDPKHDLNHDLLLIDNLFLLQYLLCYKS